MTIINSTETTDATAATALLAESIGPKTLSAWLSDERVTAITVHLSGFVPNSYRYPAPGQAVTVTRGADAWTVRYAKYDRKRAGGKGPTAVAFSAKGGRLYSL